MGEPYREYGPFVTLRSSRGHGARPTGAFEVPEQSAAATHSHHRSRRIRVGLTAGGPAFYGRDDEFTHALKYGPKFVTGIFVQWQNGKQVCIWPTDKCPSKLEFPSFVKLPGT